MRGQKKEKVAALEGGEEEDNEAKEINRKERKSLQEVGGWRSEDIKAKKGKERRKMRYDV